MNTSPILPGVPLQPGIRFERRLISAALDLEVHDLFAMRSARVVSSVTSRMLSGAGAGFPKPLARRIDGIVKRIAVAATTRATAAQSSGIRGRGGGATF